MDDLLLKLCMISAKKNDRDSIVSIDSRTILPGQVFFALPGLNHNGEDYVMSAVAKGASAVVVSQNVDNCMVPQIVVPNVYEYLIECSEVWRSLFSPHCVAVTGSNGKTTIRAMIEHVAKKMNLSVCATHGNNNNDLGVAISLMKLREQHRFAVFELGANGHNEIARLTQSVKPEISIISNISECHLSGFGSIDGVVKAKSEIFTAMSSGKAIVNVDSYGSRFLLTESDHLDVITFGKKAPGVCYGFSNVTSNKVGNIKFDLSLNFTEDEVELEVKGEHNIYNACAAIAALNESGLNLKEVIIALKSFRGVPRRLERTIISRGYTLVDDSYNASPASFKAAMATVAKYKGFKSRWLVCGDMGELGRTTIKLHEQVLTLASDYGFNLMVLGDNMRQAAKNLGLSAKHASSLAHALELIDNHVQAGDLLVIKGSRFMRMDTIVDKLKQAEHA